MSFINLTLHAIVVVSPNGETVSIAPSGQVARCSMSNTPAGVFEGISLNRTTYGSVEGLPPPAYGVMLVVSGMVRAACPDRLDLASPGDLVRNTPEGVVVGCRGLVVN